MKNLILQSFQAYCTSSRLCFNYPFGEGEDELAVGELEKDLVGEMLGKKDGSFATAGRTQVEALAGKRPEVIVPTFRVGTTDTGDALEVVATGA